LSSTYLRRWLVIAGTLAAVLIAASPANASGDDDHKRGKDLQVYKDAEGKFDRDFKFKIFKWADRDYIKSSRDKVNVRYKIAIKKSDAYDSNFTVSGKIVVRNPNQKKVRDVRVKDAIDYRDCDINGGSDWIPGYGSTTFYYVCYLKHAEEGDYGVNVAYVTWDARSIKSPHYSASAKAYFKFDKPDNDKNDCTSVKDTMDYYPTLYFGPFCYSTQFYSYRDLDVPKYGCKDFVNYATETASYSSAYAKVRVCRDRKDY